MQAVATVVAEKEGATRDCWGTFLYFAESRDRWVLVNCLSTNAASNEGYRVTFTPAGAEFY